MRTLLLILSVSCLLGALYNISTETRYSISLVLWVTSIALFYFSTPHFISHKRHHDKTSLTTWLIFFAICVFAIGLRFYLMFNTSSFHIDEYLTAHFSYSLGDVTKLNWFAVYPPLGDWICQFPLPYFFFQKLFFNIFGLSSLTMRFSILPYIIVIFVFLFLIAKRLFNAETAIVSILLLAVFSPDLYLSRWALHFISSTAAFLVTTYFFVLCIQEGKKIHFALFGFFLATCYMTYYSSYIAAPLFALYFLFLLITKKISKKQFFKFFFAGVIFIFAISPTLTYAFTVENFFTQRTSQVALINGAWSPYKDVVMSPMPILDIVGKQISISVQSLYTNGVGGHAGYWFGKLALFDKITFAFFVVGLVYLSVKTIKNKSAQSFFIICTIITSFLTGVVFTIPPPAFHRFSIAFPFIALTIAFVIVDIYLLLKKKHKRLSSVFLLITLCAVLIGNILHFNEILKTDGPDDPDFPRIQNDLEKNNATFVLIASFPSYSIGKVLYIRSNQTITSETTDLTSILSDTTLPNPYYLIVVYPTDETTQTIIFDFPNTEIINRYNTHMLLRVSK